MRLFVITFALILAAVQLSAQGRQGAAPNQSGQGALPAAAPPAAQSIALETDAREVREQFEALLSK